MSTKIAKAVVLWTVFSLFGFGVPICKAQKFHFKKIVDTISPAPDCSGIHFNRLNVPYIDINGGDLSFKAYSNGKQGIYRTDGASLRMIADTNTPIPGGSGTFSRVYDPLLSGDHIIFTGTASDLITYGIYGDMGGSLQVLADTNTLVPGSSETWAVVTHPSLSGSNYAFKGQKFRHGGGWGEPGIYANIDGTLKTIADQNTPIPGGSGTFSHFDLESGTHSERYISGKNVAFWGFGELNHHGVYLNVDGSLEVIADVNTAVPGRSGTFLSHGLPSLDGRNIAFHGRGPGNWDFGIYKYINGTLEVVADTNTPIPDGSGTFTRFWPIVSLSEDKVAFIGEGNEGQRGIYTDLCGSLSKVIALDDTLDGKKVFRLDMWGGGLGGRKIAFRVTFLDEIYEEIEAIYIAEGNGRVLIEEAIAKLEKFVSDNPESGLTKSVEDTIKRLKRSLMKQNKKFGRQPGANECGDMRESVQR